MVSRILNKKKKKTKDNGKILFEKWKRSKNG